MLRAIELARDEPSIPGQNGIRQGRIRHFAECLAVQSTANLAKLRSLRVRELQPPLQLAPQDPVFSSQILIPQQQLLVHRPRNVGPVSYTHLRAHETVLDLVCRLLLE